MLVLQNVLLPSIEKCNINEMYFNGQNYIIDNEEIKISSNGYISTDTYFNSLSLNKWKKYTKITNYSLEIEISGTCEIYVCYAHIDKNNVIRRRGDNIIKYKNDCETKKKYIFDFETKDEDVIGYFMIKALDNYVIVHNSRYISNNNIELYEINLAIGICTYKREDFVYRNIEEIKNSIFLNKKSMANGHIQVIIADNGHSLSVNRVENDNVLLVKNPNYGGSAGFTRCIIEAIKKKQQEKISHIILMDDDILLDCDAIERTYRFLTVLKDEYKDSMIGGGMLVLSEKNRQFESAALYYHGNLKFSQKNVDMRTIRNVIRNEEDRECNYNAWCYCCMPLSKINLNNLPLPLFIHMDDVEFGVRNKFNIITLNGISVWHPFFSNQRGAHIVYYDVRNKLITMAEFGGVDIRDYAMRYLEMFYKSIFNYDYERTIMACKGIEDFCKGIDYFKKISPQELNNNLLEVNKKWIDATDEIRNNVQPVVKDSISVKTLIKTYFLISKYKRVIYCCSINDAYASSSKEIVIYNKTTDKYCIYKKNFNKMLKAKIACWKAKRLINKKILEKSFEWKDRLPELENINFWEKYLGLEEKYCEK